MGHVNDLNRPIYRWRDLTPDDEGYGFNAGVYHDHRIKEIVGYEQTNCEPCGSWGWTKRLLKPIVKVTEEVVGWK